MERHRRASTVVTTNREPPGEWLAAMADPLLAQSAVDRLLSNAWQLVVEGPSYRARQRPGGHQRITPHRHHRHDEKGEPPANSPQNLHGRFTPGRPPVDSVGTPKSPASGEPAQAAQAGDPPGANRPGWRPTKKSPGTHPP